MIITLPKIIALVLGLIVISKTLTDFRKKQENWQMFLFWMIVWGSIIFIAYDPNIINQVIAHFGYGSYTIGQIFGIGFVFIMFIVYRIYVKANRLEQQLNQLIRNIALSNLKNTKTKKKKRF